MALSALYNEQLDKVNDQIYYDTKGMVSGFGDPNGPIGEMLPGEQPLREFIVDTRVKDRRPRCVRLFLYIVTLGVYWIWVNLCSCLRFKKMGNLRTRVVVTNQGRVLMWRHNSDGLRYPGCKPCCGGETTLYCTTEFRWFHLHDINSVQTVYARKRRVPICGACGVEYENEFNIGVGKNYPSNDLLKHADFDADAINTDSAVDWAAAMQLINATNAGSRKGGFCQRLFESTQKLGAATAAFSGDDGQDQFASSLLLTVVSGSQNVDATQGSGLGAAFACCRERWFDAAHQKEEDALTDATGLIRFLLNNKVSHDWTGSHPPQPQGSNFRLYDDNADAMSPLVDGTTVKIHPHLLGLTPDERVIDAFPILPRNTCFRVLCGWTRCQAPPCDRRQRTDGAVVLTNKRLFNVAQLKFPACGENGYAISSYFLGKLHAGYYIDNIYGQGGVPECSASIGTQYGGLNLAVAVSGTRGACCTANKKLDHRAQQLWKTLANGCIDSVIPANVLAVVDRAQAQSADVMQALQKLPPLMEGEQPLAGLRSHNMWALGGYLPFSVCACIAMGHYSGTAKVVQCCTCGLKPFKQDNFIVVTNMRVFTIGNVSNKGLCGCLCKKQPTVVAWSVIDDMISAQLLAEFNVPRPVGACQNFLAKTCCPCCNPAFTRLEVRLGMERSYASHPFRIRRYEDRATHGMVEGPDIMNFRKALGAVTTGRTAQEAYEIMADKQYSAYVAAANAEAGAAKGVVNVAQGVHHK